MGPRKGQIISLLDEQLPAFQEGLCSMLVSCNLIATKRSNSDATFQLLCVHMTETYSYNFTKINVMIRAFILSNAPVSCSVNPEYESWSRD
jgi:hypothetical protein